MVDLSKISLTPEEIEAMKKIRDGKGTDIKGSVLFPLVRAELANVGGEHNEEVFLTLHGSRWLKIHKRETRGNFWKAFREWFAIVISVIALLISLKEEIALLLQQAAQ